MPITRFLIAAVFAVGATFAVVVLVSFLTGNLLGETEKITVSTCNFGWDNPAPADSVGVWEGGELIDCVPQDEVPELVDWIRGFFSSIGMRDTLDPARQDLVDRTYIYDPDRPVTAPSEIEGGTDER